MDGHCNVSVPSGPELEFERRLMLRATRRPVGPGREPGLAGGAAACPSAKKKRKPSRPKTVFENLGHLKKLTRGIQHHGRLENRSLGLLWRARRAYAVLQGIPLCAVGIRRDRGHVGQWRTYLCRKLCGRMYFDGYPMSQCVLLVYCTTGHSEEVQY